MAVFIAAVFFPGNDNSSRKNRAMKRLGNGSDKIKKSCHEGNYSQHRQKQQKQYTVNSHLLDNKNSLIRR